MTTINELRVAVGMTQHQFAEVLKIPFRTIQNWEGGVRTPPAYVVELIEYKLRKEGMLKG
jgi:DNA-binding transcriptional regulator YiaG